MNEEPHSHDFYYGFKNKCNGKYKPTCLYCLISWCQISSIRIISCSKKQRINRNHDDDKVIKPRPAYKPHYLTSEPAICFENPQRIFIINHKFSVQFFKIKGSTIKRFFYFEQLFCFLLPHFLLFYFFFLLRDCFCKNSYYDSKLVFLFLCVVYLFNNGLFGLFFFFGISFNLPLDGL